jgi:hypothetical protein
VISSGRPHAVDQSEDRVLRTGAVAGTGGVHYVSLVPDPCRLHPGRVRPIQRSVGLRSRQQDVFSDEYLDGKRRAVLDRLTLGSDLRRDATISLELRNRLTRPIYPGAHLASRLGRRQRLRTPRCAGGAISMRPIELCTCGESASAKGSGQAPRGVARGNHLAGLVT